MANPEVLFGLASTAAHTAVVDAVVEGLDRDYCGLSWVVIKPASGIFVKYLKDNGIGRNEIGGGWRVPRHAMATYRGQSMGVNEAAATAFADVLQTYGVKAYARSRVD